MERVWTVTERDGRTMQVRMTMSGDGRRLERMEHRRHAGRAWRTVTQTVHGWWEEV